MLLIPLLDDLPAAIQDDAILATIVILRMSEQHNEYDTDRQFHLVPGAFSHYGPIRRSSTTEGGLQEATFYSNVKSDIRVAILERRWTKLAVDSWPLDNAEPQNDADWANRVTWLLVQAINLCYGGQDIPGLLPRHLLERYVDEWKRDLPDTFDPYYFHEPDTEPFPVIRLLAPWHSSIFPVPGIDNAHLVGPRLTGSSCRLAVLSREQNPPCGTPAPWCAVHGRMAFQPPTSGTKEAQCIADLIHPREAASPN